MRSRTSVRFVVLASVILCGLAACTGDDEIYAVPKDAGSAALDGPAASSGGPSSSSSGGTNPTDGGATNDAATDGGTGNDGSTNLDGGDGGTNDSGVVIDSGVDSGPVVCTTVPCAANATCTAVGCGSCNMGIGFCKL